MASALTQLSRASGPGDPLLTQPVPAPTWHIYKSLFDNELEALREDLRRDVTGVRLVVETAV
jgi:hypothetical protein